MTAPYDFSGEAPVRDLTQRRIKPTTIHSDLVEDSRAARNWWEGERERHGIGYRAETQEFVAAHPSPTLRGFLREADDERHRHLVGGCPGVDCGHGEEVMILYADSNYSFNPWMRDIGPRMDPESEQGEVLRAEEIVAEIANQVPMPPPAGIQPRFGAMKTEPTVEEVLGVPSTSGLRESELGQQGYGGPALGKW